MIQDFLLRCTKRVYAGIGSRETPRDVLDLMTRIAKRLDAEGWTLRSGGADGADTAFENGASKPEIYLPWPGFNERRQVMLARPSVKAEAIAASHHPRWYGMRDSVRKLTARNTHQILGHRCDDPSAFVVCWTKEGAFDNADGLSGGTNQAIRVAVAYGVPVFNLKRDDHRTAWKDWLDS